MLELNINLLSAEKRHRLGSILNFVFAKNILSVVSFIFALFSIALIWSWILLVDQFESLSQDAISINREYSQSSAGIRKINKTVRELNLAGKNYAKIMPKILEFIASVPEDITLNSIDVNRETKTFSIAGVAKNRSALLAYQEELREIAWLENFISPTSQLFEKNDVQFVIKAELKNIPAPANYIPPKKRVNLEE